LKNATNMTLMLDFVAQDFLGAGTSLAKSNIPIVPHPPYTPDLAPSDFWLFPTLKMGLRGTSVRNVEDMKENAYARLRAIKKDFHQCYNWIDRCNKCECADGKYFEGD
jgi:hypothetical protein